MKVLIDSLFSPLQTSGAFVPLWLMTIAHYVLGDNRAIHCSRSSAELHPQQDFHQRSSNQQKIRIHQLVYRSKLSRLRAVLHSRIGCCNLGPVLAGSMAENLCHFLAEKS